MKYQLVQEICGHQADVRCVCELSSTSFASGGRDRLAKIWTKNDKVYQELKTTYDHQHWVSAMCTLPEGMGFLTGSQDKMIRWYDVNGNLLKTIEGHQGPVSSIAWNASKNEFVSGSWDGTAKCWSINGTELSVHCTATLAGHENGVCVHALPNGDIVTGSAGVQAGNKIEGFQLRVWKDGQVVKSVQNHRGAIRSLCSAAKDGSVFASTSNDGTVRVWSSESFQELSCMSNPIGAEGAPAFNFCVSPAESFQKLASACDDCCVRVWDTDSGKMEEEIPHPCTVWCVTTLENGDIVTGSADGFVRIFTTDESRQAPEELRQIYLEQTMKAREAIAKKASNQGNKVNPEKLQKIYEAGPGNADGDVKMFNKDGQAWVYQWSQESGTWMEVGEVMGDAGGEELDGKIYDKVIPVELEDPSTGGLRNLKLGFNQGDNPYVVAQQFIEKHGLQESHVEEIANFIQNVRGQDTPMIDMSGGGGGGGTGASSSSSSSSSPDAMEIDNGLFPFPTITGLAFESVKLDQVFGKLEELNGAYDDSAKLSEDELDSIKNVVQVLKETSRYHSSSVSSKGIKAIQKILDSWEQKDSFPALDLIRIILTHPQGSSKVGTEQILEKSLALGSGDGAPLALALLGSRVAANFFRHRESAMTATHVVVGPGGNSKVLGPLKELSGFPNKNVRSAVATAYLNISNGLCHVSKTTADSALVSKIVGESLALAGNCLDQGAKEAESVRRCLLAIGCATALQAFDSADVDDILAMINRSLATIPDSQPLIAVCDALKLIIRSKHK